MADAPKRTLPLLKNTKLVKTEWGFEIHKRIMEDREDASQAEAERSLAAGFKQMGAGVATTIQNHLGRDLTFEETNQLYAEGFVEL
jgi:hypothetical protein